MKEATTRDDLMKARDDILTVLSAMEGNGPEMTDRAAVLALTRAIWCLFDFLIKRTWGL